jgi:hypothetical protein
VAGAVGSLLILSPLPVFVLLLMLTSLSCFWSKFEHCAFYLLPVLIDSLRLKPMHLLREELT